MTPVEQYNACLSLPGFIDDAAQRERGTHGSTT